MTYLIPLITFFVGVGLGFLLRPLFSDTAPDYDPFWNE